MMTVTDGACIFCGQIIQVEVEAGSLEEEINGAATMQCGCFKALVYRQQQKAAATINDKFREKHSEMADLLINAIEPLQKHKIKGITLDSGRGVKGSMAMGSKGEIKIKREDKATSESTVC